MGALLWFEYFASGVLLTTLCAFGLVGNSLTLYILNVNSEMRKQGINIYLTVLALYDNGVLFNAILMLGVPAFYKFKLFEYQEQSLPEDFRANLFNSSDFYNSTLDNYEFNIESVNESFALNDTLFLDNKVLGSRTTRQFQDPLYLYIRIVYPLALISQTGSIWTTCLITLERYLAVCHPLKAMLLSKRNRAIWSLLALSLGALLYNLPRFAEIDIQVNSDGSARIARSGLRENKIYYWLYYICSHLALLYIFPLSLLSVLNTKIYLTVREASRNRSNLTRHQESELNLASMLVLLVAIFIGCNAPTFVVNCLELYGFRYLQVASIVSNLLVCTNSSINFLIYCIFGKKFREKLKNTIMCRKKRKRKNSKKTTNGTRTQLGDPADQADEAGETFV